MGEELGEAISTCAGLGFPGAAGSMDVTHVKWDKAPTGRSVCYTGKEGRPTILRYIPGHCGPHRACSGGDRRIRKSKKRREHRALRQFLFIG
ncbi:unnamed protein product [Discosporangium mesarthrocarpum]